LDIKHENGDDNAVGLGLLAFNRWMDKKYDEKMRLPRLGRGWDSDFGKDNPLADHPHIRSLVLSQFRQSAKIWDGILEIAMRIKNDPCTRFL
jgi:hypothetical protein